MLWYTYIKVGRVNSGSGDFWKTIWKPFPVLQDGAEGLPQRWQRTQRSHRERDQPQHNGRGQETFCRVHCRREILLPGSSIAHMGQLQVRNRTSASCPIPHGMKALHWQCELRAVRDGELQSPGARKGPWDSGWIRSRAMKTLEGLNKIREATFPLAPSGWGLTRALARRG